jgi:uncharacterized membrane protein AbrB (regulator of aidB expression)
VGVPLLWEPSLFLGLAVFLLALTFYFLALPSFFLLSPFIFCVTFSACFSSFPLSLQQMQIFVKRSLFLCEDLGGPGLPGQKLS